jgi:hypothetical protein
MDNILAGNTRDKMLIVAMTWLATYALSIAALLAWFGKLEIAGMTLGIPIAIGGAFAVAYKGNPTADSQSPTAAVTSTKETTTKETVSDKKGT